MSSPKMLTFQYRKRYGLHAIPQDGIVYIASAAFQYRKRYGLHAMAQMALLSGLRLSFNTASGMDCMQ